MQTRKLWQQPQRKKGSQIKRGKVIKVDINKSKGGLLITEAAAKAVLKSYPPLERLGKKPVEHANARKLFKYNNMGCSHIMFPCPVKNCRSVESLFFPYVISPLHHFTIHHCIISFILHIIIFVIIQGNI